MKAWGDEELGVLTHRLVNTDSPATFGPCRMRLLLKCAERERRVRSRLLVCSFSSFYNDLLIQYCSENLIQVD